MTTDQALEHLNSLYADVETATVVSVEIREVVG